MKACQDVSHAGRRLGMKPGTRSGLWSHMAYAIDKLRPRLVVAENVRGLLSAEAGGDVESCAWCVGDGSGSPLRALGAVLGDLADLGYDAQWHGVRASDVGAPHGRFRVFVVAWPAADPEGAGLARQQPLGRAAQEPSPVGSLLPTPRTTDMNGAGAHGEGGLDLRTAVGLLPTPRATDGTNGGPNQRGSFGDLMLPSAVTHLLPTPAVNDMGAGKTVEAWDEWTAKMQAAHGNGNGHGKSLAIEAQRVAPHASPMTETLSHVDSAERRPAEDLRGVRCRFDPQAVSERAARGQVRLPEAPELFSGLREQSSGGHPVGAQLPCEAVPEGSMRGLRDDAPAPRASRRPELDERRPSEPADPLRVMPPAAPLARGPRGACSCGTSWGPYKAAVHRWEDVLGRCAPLPTVASAKGTPQLNPQFSEFMMGLPAGHVTAVPGLSRNEQLKALGNGVVPQQAAHAIRLWLATLRQQVAA